MSFNAFALELPIIKVVDGDTIATYNHTKEIVGTSKMMTLSNCSHDKYGGRFVCDVFINGKFVSESLIKAGLARSYDGGKKQSWCGE